MNFHKSKTSNYSSEMTFDTKVLNLTINPEKNSKIREDLSKKYCKGIMHMAHNTRSDKEKLNKKAAECEVSIVDALQDPKTFCNNLADYEIENNKMTEFSSGYMRHKCFHLTGLKRFADDFHP